jgi:hypothetical protein
MQLNPTQTPLQKNPDLRSWALVAIAAIAWVILYNFIQPFADWLAYGLLGLEHGSHLGESRGLFLIFVAKIIVLLSGMLFFF